MYSLILLIDLYRYFIEKNMYNYNYCIKNTNKINYLHTLHLTIIYYKFEKILYNITILRYYYS